MPDYRAYIVGSDGHFAKYESFSCPDDGEAVIKAKQLVEGCDVELWEGERFIVRLYHKDK